MHSEHDPQNGPQNGPWSEYRQRREEWRASRRERREAWREMRRARHAAWHGMWGGHETAEPPSNPGTKAMIADMQATIDRLLERVAVLEKLATDDDRKLAAEIERLRNTEPKT